MIKILMLAIVLFSTPAYSKTEEEMKQWQMCDMFAQDAANATIYYNQGVNADELMQEVDNSNFPGEEKHRILSSIAFVWQQQIDTQIAGYLMGMFACMGFAK
jgi:hypothetical protein